MCILTSDKQSLRWWLKKKKSGYFSLNAEHSQEPFVDSLPVGEIPYLAVYNAHLCVWTRLSEKNTFRFSFLIQLFIYLYLETKLIIVFQGIILFKVSLLLSRVTLVMHEHKLKN